MWDDVLTGPVGLIAEYTLLKVLHISPHLYINIIYTAELKPVLKGYHIGSVIMETLAERATFLLH